LWNVKIVKRFFQRNIEVAILAAASVSAGDIRLLSGVRREVFPQRIRGTGVWSSSHAVVRLDSHPDSYPTSKNLSVETATMQKTPANKLVSNPSPIRHPGVTDLSKMGVLTPQKPFKIGIV